jgi:predicted DNA-binding ribbon-helix-helix protein
VVVKHSIILAGHKTSVSMEDEFWHELRKIAQDRKLTLANLVTEIDRAHKGNLSSAIRVFVLECVQEEALKAKVKSEASE